MEENHQLFIAMLKLQINSTFEPGLFIFDSEPNFFPVEEIPFKLKAFGLSLYLMTFPSILVIFTFIYYESQGYAGQFRTIINQLVSWLYLTVS